LVRRPGWSYWKVVFLAVASVKVALPWAEEGDRKPECYGRPEKLMKIEMTLALFLDAIG
jgi:hypothetical protein